VLTVFRVAMADDGDNTLAKPEYIPFLRITVLGMTGCGKTALVNAFVNSICPTRYVSTTNQVLYYRKVSIRDEGEFDVILRPMLLEVEDTPGSEKAPDGVGQTDDNDTDGPPGIQRGSRVEVIKDRYKVINAFNDEKWRLKLEYKKAMDGMLGKEFTVKLKSRDGSIGLPSPDGSEGGIWNFPPEVLNLVVRPEMPLDKFLSMARREMHVPKDPKEKKEMAENMEKPLSAYNRRIGPPDVDKAHTRNRMGFFICFDLSEEDSASLKEALKIHAQIVKYLKSRGKKSGEGNPVIMFIGTKCDKTSGYQAIERNYQSAKFHCDSEDMKVIKTSAKTNEKVEEAFHTMVEEIRAREVLWQLQGVDADDDGTGDDEGGLCCVS